VFVGVRSTDPRLRHAPIPCSSRSSFVPLFIDTPTFLQKIGLLFCFCLVFVNGLWLLVLACCLSRFNKIMAQQEDNRKIEITAENTIVMDQQINVARSELKNLRYY
jgi:hypothetical protein